jgi:hypothetical protein
MTTRNRLTVIAMVAAAALLSSAPSTSAQIEISDEINGGHCPAVSPSNVTYEHPPQWEVEGGCVVHISNTEGNVVLTAHIFGIESTDSTCTQEFDARIGKNGEGYLTNIQFGSPAGGGTCNRETCRNGDNDAVAWELHTDETVTGPLRLEIHMCMWSVGGGGLAVCHIDVPFADISSSFRHRYELGTVNTWDIPVETGCESFSGFRGELSGHWTTEEEPIGAGRTTIEFAH